MSRTVERTEAEWRTLLTDERYRILRAHGTEPPFANAYWDEHTPGVYRCGACGATLFDARDKFDSGTGWPSFLRPVDTAAVEERTDASAGLSRTEVLCAACGSHLGHVFDDGPGPHGRRYCMNSGALDLDPRE